MASKKRILVQAGHIAPREPGFESGTGTVREQEFTRKLRDALVVKLNADDRFDAIPCPGNIPDGIKVEAAIFEHGDGSDNHSASGFSMGYPNFAPNRKLANMIVDEYLKIDGHPPHHIDNYTPGLRSYYGYSRVNTEGPEVLVESGFLTNPREQSWLFGHIPDLALAQYKALCRYFGIEPHSDDAAVQSPWEGLPGPSPKPDWFWDAIEDYNRRIGRK